MADITKLKTRRKNRNALGGAQPPADASLNLSAPEHGPVATPPSEALKTPRNAYSPSKPRIDGRTLRKTGRTIQFSTRVTPEFDQRIRELAQIHGLKIVEVLEQALDSFEKDAR